MSHLIVAQVRHQEQVAKAVVHLQFRSQQVVRGDAQVGGKETLEVALALDGTADGGVLLIRLGDKRQGLLPLPVESHGIIDIPQVIQIDVAVCLIFFQ